MSHSTETTRCLSCAETAKLVRAELKAQFPGIKFSVRSETYSGGASIHIGWNDGPTEKAVEAVVGRYAGADFDGMTDMKTYREDTLLAGPDGTVELVSFGANYIFCRRGFSEVYRAKLEAEAAKYIGAPVETGRWYTEIETPYGWFQDCTGHAFLGWLSQYVPPSA